MKELILIKYGEIILKGLNRSVFEDKLMTNIKRRLKRVGEFKVYRAQAAVYAEPLSEGASIENAILAIKRVFGVVSISRVACVEKDIEEIKKVAVLYLKEFLDGKSFKVETKRADKRFGMQSPEISAEVGKAILDSIATSRVNVVNPDTVVRVEIRDFGAYVYVDRVRGAGGMPTGTNGKAALMLSGGIDSPVAGYAVAKRGVELDVVHFYSYPYTSERSKQKVIDLANILSSFCGRINMHIVPFTDIQLEINEKCNPDLITLIMRRIMMQITEKIAINHGCQAIVTGESIGQVASQTMHSLAVTDSVVNMPVFRPLIGMDKEEVVDVARKIGTFETSILPYDDCCTVFTPRHPVTKPNEAMMVAAEEVLDIKSMVEIAVEQTEHMTIQWEG